MIATPLPRSDHLARCLVAKVEVAKTLPDRDILPTDYSHSDRLVKEFVQLPLTELVQRAQYLIDHPETRRLQLPDLLKEAVEHMSKGDAGASQKWIHSLVMLKLSENTKEPHLIECFQRMQTCNTMESQQLRRMVVDITAQVQRSTVAKANPAQTYKRSTPSVSGAARARDRHSPGPDNASPYYQQLAKTTSPVWVEGVAKSGTVPDSISMLAPWQEHLRPALQPDRSMDARLQSLSSRYKVQRDGANFFRPGRVFAILWHEPVCEVRPVQMTDHLTQPRYEDMLGPNMTQGPYGEYIYSHIRRMVVIRNRKGYCWCIPISTYSGQGLRGRGLGHEEINSHAIVYDSKKEPRCLPGEIQSTRTPIAVDVIPGHSLSQATRVHYARPHTVGWNTKVMDVGTVSSRCAPILLSDVACELFEDSHKQRS